ncbi:sugar ABC transporter ATP-binding protein [Cellulomonas aerilata]|uniref:Sugar ABC transporter ATP-binding protein n=1 Tax=Cellulomonas aerilata TaxID=515326 RepID=A0A512D8E5_9CELL|nr:sugar ABC transporter ATP-binding protein [Cellulomonas aerilata]GEO32758.1 sugar ABC transporter ATP-binding protein [Cellulomonas aerilata]
MTTPSPAVEMTGISIEFPGVKALDGVNFRLFPGEVHSLMGENGAGKSTLIKALTGVYGIDSGRITVFGVPQTFTGPAQAQAAGISTVYQEVNLCENLSVAENIMLGHEPRTGGRIDWRRLRREASTYLAQLGLDIDPRSLLSSHSLAVQQLVAISRAMVVDAKVLILDEPTSSLDAGEVQQLFSVMRVLRAQGVAILFVSHFLDQIYAISDRLTVLRNGQLVGEYLVGELPRRQLVSKMIGQSLEVLEQLEDAPRRTTAARTGAQPVFQAIGLGRRGAIEPFDLDLFEGEVVGLAGLLGSGRTELARLLYGADHADAGELAVAGKQGRMRGPRAAMKQGIAFSSEHRKAEGIVGDLTVRENLMLALQADRGWARRIPARKADEVVSKYIAALGIRPANPDALVRNLSGGNQQKVLLGRWLATAPRLLILDEPTRGIDVGAKAEIQRLVASLASDGMAVVFISAELDEVLRLSHRIAVMRDRRKVAEIDNDDSTTLDDVVELIASGGTS